MQYKKVTGIVVLGVALIGGYVAYDYFAGNHVEIDSVISSNAQTTSTSAATSTSTSDGVPADKLNGTWTIQQPSKVYFSVTTSKESVNFVVDSVQGKWNLNLDTPNQMSGEGSVDLQALNSGNSTRDGHVKGEKFLQIDANPKATFTAKSFEQLPKTWKEGSVVPLKMSGTLNVKGISKEVTFSGEAVYEQDAVKMSGSTVVTFEDFGMKNPHAVVVSTQNDVTVRLELVLKKN